MTPRGILSLFGSRSFNALRRGARLGRHARGAAAVQSLENRCLLSSTTVEHTTFEEVDGFGVIERAAVDLLTLEDMGGAYLGNTPGGGGNGGGSQINGAGLQFVLNPTPETSQQAIDGFQQAADLWSAILTDDITVYIDVDFSDLPGSVLGSTSSTSAVSSYASFRTALINDATSLDDFDAVGTLRDTSALNIYTSDFTTGAAETDNNGTANNTHLAVNTAVQKATGLRSAGNTASDGAIAFDTGTNWDFDPSDGIASGALDFVGVAAHEIGHLLGFTSSVDSVDHYIGTGQELDGFAVVKPLDLFRHSAASVANGADLDNRADTDDKYFSLDDGATEIADFSTGVNHGDGRQGSHWKDNHNHGLLDPTIGNGEYGDITDLDVRAFDVMGWDVRMDFGDAPDSYDTSLAEDGARHITFSASGATNDPEGAAKVFLGSGVTSELDGQPHAGSEADADDGVSVSGVTFTGNETATFTVVSTAGGATLDYFFDWNQNGVFTDAGESFSATLNSTSQQVSVAVPISVADGTTAARFRISTAGNLAATGPANDGEVEDYAVTLEASNHAPSVSAATFSIKDTDADGTALGTVTASDSDGDTLAFAITAGNADGAFAISSSTGQITLADVSKLDPRNTPTRSLTVTATDDGTPVLNASGTITVNVVEGNRAPVAADQTFSVDENSAAGTVVGTITAADYNLTDTLSFALGSGSFPFEISAAGVITVAENAFLDFEGANSFDLPITVTDDGDPAMSDTATVTVDLNDVNEAPEANWLFTPADELSPAGTVVGTITIADPEGDAFSLTFDAGESPLEIVAGSTAGSWEVRVTDAEAFDYETAPTSDGTFGYYGISWTATEDTGDLLSANWSDAAAARNIDEAPIFFPFSPGGVAESDELAAAVSIGKIDAFDPDGVATLAYSVSGDERFAIDSATGELTAVAGSAFDHESEPTIALTVTATEVGGERSSDAAVTVTITDVDEAPAISIGVLTVAENSQPGTVVGSVTVTDPEGDDSTLAVATAGSPFAVIPSGTAGVWNVVVVDQSGIDHETATAGDGLRYLDVEFTGTNSTESGLSSDKAGFVEITDVDEAPEFAAFTPGTVAESDALESAVSLGTVSASDPDFTGRTMSYSLSGDDRFEVDADTGEVTAKAGSFFDHEAEPSVDLTVTAAEVGGTLSSTLDFTVQITDVDEAPVLSVSPLSVLEHAAVGTLVGTITVTDPEGDVSDLTLDDPVSPFTLEASGEAGVWNVVVSDSAGTDFETALDLEGLRFISLGVTATNETEAGLSASANFLAEIEDIDEAPVFGTLEPESLFETDSLVEPVVIGTAAAADPDEANQPITYSLSGDDRFSINADTGVVTAKEGSAFDFEAEPTIDLTVTATEIFGQLSSTLDFTVQLINVNEAPSLTGFDVTVEDDIAGNTVIAAVSGNDPDAGTFLTYAITAGNDENLFVIDPFSGAVSLAGEQSLAGVEATYTLTVSVSDDADPALTDTAAAVITVIPANPVTIEPQAFALNEEGGAGDVVGTVAAATRTEGVGLTFTIVDGNTAGRFAIDANTGRITTAENLSFETAGGTHQFIVSAAENNGSGEFAEALMTVTLGDVNDAPVLEQSGFNLPETAKIGREVGALFASDEDGDALTYSIVGGDGATALAIDGETGVVTVTNPRWIDYEQATELTIRVAITDGESTVEQDIVVPVLDADESGILTVSGDGTVTLSHSTGLRFNVVTLGTLPAGTDPAAVQYGDFNGDGTKDILVDDGAGRWYVGLRDGDAMDFTLWRSSWSTITDVTVGDFDGDGDDDIAGLMNVDNRWRLGKSDGTRFVNASFGYDLDGGDAAARLVADFDGDGRDDRAALDAATGQWHLAVDGVLGWEAWGGTWDATFGNWQVADFDGNGLPDIAGWDSSTGNWRIDYGNGTDFPESDARATRWSATAAWQDITTGDFDGDGAADLIGNLGGRSFYVALIEPGTFQRTFNWGIWPPNFPVYEAVIGDFNGDGMDDLAGFRGAGGKMQMSLSIGTRFQSRIWQSGFTFDPTDLAAATDSLFEDHEDFWQF